MSIFFTCWKKMPSIKKNKNLNKSWIVSSWIDLRMNCAKAEMWKAEKSGLNHLKQNWVKQISGFAPHIHIHIHELYWCLKKHNHHSPTMVDKYIAQFLLLEKRIRNHYLGFLRVKSKDFQAFRIALVRHLWVCLFVYGIYQTLMYYRFSIW